MKIDLEVMLKKKQKKGNWDIKMTIIDNSRRLEIQRRINEFAKQLRKQMKQKKHFEYSEFVKEVQAFEKKLLD